jgi:hypothetical protein
MIVRNKNDQESGIGIVVADYLPARNAWVRAFERATPISKPTTFTLGVADLAGDHSPMIVCTGLDRYNRQNLVAFRRIASASPLSFSLACSVGGDFVEIEEKDRPESYELEKSGAAPWDILAYTRDPASTNFLDRQKTTWRWNKVRYEEVSREKVPGAATEHEALLKVLAGSEGSFDTYIQGLWYREDAGFAGENARFIYFDARGKAITFKSSSAQEEYSWTDSNPTSSGIYAVLENVSVRELRRFAGIDLIGADRLRIRVDDERSMRILPDNGYSGSYRRLPRGSDHKPASGIAQIKLPSDLGGEYRSASGGAIRFFAQEFVSESSPGKAGERGRFRLYQLGEDLVLDLAIVGSDGLPAGRKLYKAAFSVVKTQEGTRKTLILLPVLMGMGGIVALEEKMDIYSTGCDS